MIPIAKPIIGDEEKKAVLDVLDSGMLAQGKKVQEFEDSFAKLIGVKHAIATSNGTTALHATLLAHNIGPGDEVITTPFTFIATANAIKMAGATPVFVDIDEKTFNIDPDLIEGAITAKTKAIIPVHLFGLPAEMDRIKDIADRHNLIIIEDACQAHNSEFQLKKAGSFGTGCFSFYPTKNITTGEGGMITTNNDFIAKKVRKIINHGSEQQYYHDILGYNFRMTDLAAAIGIAQLKYLQEFTVARRRNAAYLSENLQNIPGLILPEIKDGHVFHQYTIKITPEFKLTREEFINHLYNNGIACSIFYPLPIHQQQTYSEYNHLSFPISEKISQQVLSLPVHPSLTKEDLLRIASVIREAGS